MCGEEEKIKLKNGVKVFTRMADNAKAVSLAIVECMKEMRKDDETIRFLIPRIDRIMASSSTNFIFYDTVFQDGDDTDSPKIANRVLEIYFRFKKESSFNHDFLISLSADIGSNNIVFAMGWDDEQVANEHTSLVHQVMNKVIQRVLDDMDLLIEEEGNHVRKMSYVNIIQNEINKKIESHKADHPDDLKISWPTGDTTISSVACEVEELSNDVVDLYPVRKFRINCSDDEGTPLFRVLTRVKDPSSKSTDENFETFLSVFDADSYSDYMRVSSAQPAAILALDVVGGTALINAILPAIERVIPDISILQSAILEQTVNKIGNTAERS